MTNLTKQEEQAPSNMTGKNSIVSQWAEINPIEILEYFKQCVQLNLLSFTLDSTFLNSFYISH